MSKEHTPGPWETPGEDGGERVISFTDSKGKRRTLAHVYDGEEFESMEANARRIVACVNACEALTQDGVEEVIRSFCGFGGLMDKAKACATERDAALERERVLRGALSTVQGMAEDGKGAKERATLMPKIANVARAALALTERKP